MIDADPEKIDNLRKSEGWAEFVKALKSMADDYQQEYSSCKEKEDFVRVQEKIKQINLVIQLPDALIDRQGG